MNSSDDISLASCLARERHQARKKNVYYDLGIWRMHLIEYREGVVSWALGKLGVHEWLIRTVLELYTEACTVDITDAGLS